MYIHVEMPKKNGLKLAAHVTSRAFDKPDGLPTARFPSALIVLCCLCNTCSYTIEFATFAVYFRQVHKWNEADSTIFGSGLSGGLGWFEIRVSDPFRKWDPDIPNRPPKPSCDACVSIIGWLVNNANINIPLILLCVTLRQL